MTRPTVTIVIPTFQRPAGLLDAARSVFSQSLLSVTACTLVIIDNDPSATAAGAIKTLRAEAPEHLIFIADHEPQAGVANARNRAMGHVTTDLVAFLDDDQIVQDPDWLSKLYNLCTDFNPAVAFGPVKTLLPETVKAHRRYFEDFFARTDPAPRGFIPNFHGCSNTLMDTAQLPKQRPLFDPGTNESGGEDDILFDQIATEGGRFAWEPDAVIAECVPAHRANLRYTLRRAVAYGQGPTSFARLHRKYHILVGWMVLGALKFMWHGLRAGVGFLFRLDNRAAQLDLAMRGWGKVTFWTRFNHYGAAALRDPASIRQQETLAATKP